MVGDKRGLVRCVHRCELFGKAASLADRARQDAVGQKVRHTHTILLYNHLFTNKHNECFNTIPTLYINIHMKKAIIALAAGLAMTLPAQAEVITFNFTATVSSIQEIDAPGWPQVGQTGGSQAGGSIALTDRVVGTFSFDTAAPSQPVWGWDASGNLITYTPDPESSEPSEYSYNGVPGQHTLTFSIGNGADTFYMDGSTSSQLRLDNRASTDMLALAVGGLGRSFGEVGFYDYSATVFANGVLPMQLSLSDFGAAGLAYSFIRASDGKFVLLGAAIDSVTLASSVPEPQTYAMLLAGLAIFGVAARRRSRRA